MEWTSNSLKSVYRKKRKKEVCTVLHTHIHTRARSFNFIFGVLIIAAHFYVVRFLFDCFVFALILIYKSRHIFLHTPHIFVDRQSHTISCATSCIHTSTYFTVKANFSRSLFFPLCFAGFKLCFHNVFFSFLSYFVRLFSSAVSYKIIPFPFEIVFNEKNYPISMKTEPNTNEMVEVPANGKIMNQVGTPIYFAWKAMAKGFRMMMICWCWW